ncbi:uncharacterized protein LOC126673322 [Mercurialis annua]|uniref:uncharacterized protein LOC126673322 n=1 Tax=Mercurialis annua TaxID=3986 RepID=UPI0021609991|nr:uncharacterized protein LOC126673322 [Mercurialis annua]
MNRIVQCPTLEELTIVNCPTNFACKILGEPEANASYETTAAKVLFPKLKYLKLSIVKFEKIWQARQWELSHLLQILTAWNLEGCGNLKYLLSSSMVKCLPHHKTLEICNCMSMEEIVVAEEFEGRLGELFLPELNLLKLKDLPKLVQFCQSDLLECPALESLWIEKCFELRTFISNAQSSNKTAGNELEMLNSSLFDEKVFFLSLFFSFLLIL